MRSSHAYCAVHLRHFCGRYVHEPKARHSSPSSSARNSRCKGIGSRRGSWLATTLLALWVSSALCVLPARLWLLSTSLLRAGLSSISLLCALSVLPALLRALLRGTRPYQAPSFALKETCHGREPRPTVCGTGGVSEDEVETGLDAGVWGEDKHQLVATYLIPL